MAFLIKLISKINGNTFLNKQRGTCDNFQTRDNRTIDSVETRGVQRKRNPDVDIGEKSDYVERIKRLIDIILRFLVYLEGLHFMDYISKLTEHVCSRPKKLYPKNY